MTSKNTHLFNWWSTKYENMILEPFTYSSRQSGEGIFRELALAFNYWFRISDEKLEIIDNIIEMLQIGSNLIDDIEDNSATRGGCPSAQKIFGLPLSLNCGNYVYFLALQKCLSLDHPQVPNIFTEQILRAHRGQGLEIYWRDHLVCPSEEEYKEVTFLKVGSILGLIVKLMQLFSTNTKDYTTLLNNMSLILQIEGDLTNLVNKTNNSKESFAGDLTEGKFSYPILVAIHKDPNDHQIISILRQRTDELFLKRHCVGLIQKMGVLDYTVKYLIDLENQCKKSIEELGSNPHLEGLLDKFSKIYREFKSDNLQL